jgi:hypothetical protein
LTRQKCDAYSITSEKFIGLRDWLQGEVAAGRVAVETTAQVIG